MASSSSSSKSSETKYHVFLSFRGEDTRDNFTSHLYAALCSKKINTFIDDELHRGDEISQAVLNAIGESKVAVIIFSKGYATSRWCLEELVKIIECKKSGNLIAVPVFYKVDPSDVRNQTGTFGEAFLKHEERFEQSLEKVLRWKSALTEAANLSGFDSKNIRSEAALIEEIVKFILKILNHLSQIDNTGLVGIQSRIKEIESLLCIESIDVFKSVGLWGMGGIGKTTLARAVFTKLSSQFESVYFQSKVREESEKFGLIRLSRELLSAILEDQWAILESTFSKNRLHNKKVFIVFDDVTCSSQIEKLIGDLECFGSGSRIIITARDKQVLKNCGVSRDNIYAVKGLVLNHAVKLFSRHAFRLDYPPTGYMELSLRAIAFAKGVPLALKVLGASLFEKTNSEWESALRNLERNPNPKIQDVLKISYDGLDDQEKNIFLDIACLSLLVDRKNAIKILDANGFDSEIGVSSLIDKSLITIILPNTIEMHDLLQKMGQKIVEQESKHPGKRSRLWHHDDIYHVLRGNTGTEAIECISLDFSKIKEINLNRNAFLKMQSLRFLDFYSSKMIQDYFYSYYSYYSNGFYYCRCFLAEFYPTCPYCLLDEEYKLNAPQGLKFDSPNLRYFRWFGYPLTSLPSNFDMENLVALIMPGSKIKQLWNGHLYLDKLRHLNLVHSKHLTRIPELSMIPNLESLSLAGCTSLIEVPPSIQYLNKLVILNLKGCKSLRSLPTYIRSKFLRYLILSGCSSLKMAPKITCMERVYLDGTSITELPLIECPSRLEYLNLEDCSRLESLPSIICEIKSLGSLRISGCSKLHNLPKHFGKLESLFELGANNTSIRKLPCSILYLNKLKKLCLGGYRGEDLLVDSVWPFLSDLSSLEYLDLSDCQIMRLPDSLGQLSSIQILNLSRNNFEWIPSSILQLSLLSSLDISYCERLKNLPKLPRKDQNVDTYNCISLELCDSDSILSACSINLGNCFKVDQNMLKFILEKKHYARGGICFPGNEIPEWFIFQNVGFSATLELPPLAGDEILESWFTVCLVVTSPELDKAPQSLAVRCKLIGIDKYGKRQEIYEGEDITGFQCSGLMSDHVILTNVHPEWDETEWRYVNLDFSGENYIVKKCGVKLRFYEDCAKEYEKQFSGYFSSNIEEEERGGTSTQKTEILIPF